MSAISRAKWTVISHESKSRGGKEYENVCRSHGMLCDVSVRACGCISSAPSHSRESRPNPLTLLWQQPGQTARQHMHGVAGDSR